MKLDHLLAVLLTDRPAQIGTFGTIGTMMLDRVHTAVGIAVGLTTILYLVIKIRRDLRK